MGRVGEELDIDFVVSTGDNFYDNGLSGIHDTTFEKSFSKVYTAPSLQKQWYNGKSKPPRLLLFFYYTGDDADFFITPHSPSPNTCERSAQMSINDKNKGIIGGGVITFMNKKCDPKEADGKGKKSDRRFGICLFILLQFWVTMTTEEKLRLN